MLIRDYKTNKSTTRNVTRLQQSISAPIFYPRITSKMFMLISTITRSIKNLLTRSDSTSESRFSSLSLFSVLLWSSFLPLTLSQVLSFSLPAKTLGYWSCFTLHWRFYDVLISIPLPRFIPLPCCDT